MAASPAASSRPSAASSSSSTSLRRSDGNHHHLAKEPSISIDTLVNHLLVAKRSLSSMNLVLRANELATSARTSHEEGVILEAQAGFLRSSIVDQIAILVRVRRSLHATYDWGKRDFKKLIRAMDEVDGQLGATMDMLSHTDVQQELRPVGEEKRSLLDFVDETSVHGMREAMMKSIEELQVSHPSDVLAWPEAKNYIRASNSHSTETFYALKRIFAISRRSSAMRTNRPTRTETHQPLQCSSYWRAWMSSRPPWPICSRH